MKELKEEKKVKMEENEKNEEKQEKDKKDKEDSSKTEELRSEYGARDEEQELKTQTENEASTQPCGRCIACIVPIFKQET